MTNIICLDEKYKMINIQESQTVEFKQSWKDEYLKTICAFANTDGGILYVGITDDGSTENWGKGTLNIINECVEYGLPKPTFEYEWTAVRTTFYKTKANEQASDQAILEFCKEAKSTQEIMNFVGMKHKTYFRKHILNPLLEKELLELTLPDKPKSPNQKYKRSEK